DRLHRAVRPAVALGPELGDGLRGLGQARADLVQARMALASSRVGEALPLLLSTAQRLVPLDAGLARETFLDALSAAMFAGRLASGTSVREVAEAAQKTAPPTRQ
ncbi:hypothetical protein ABZ372_40935, partial [Streptomyces sp. NPDC005921]